MRKLTKKISMLMVLAMLVGLFSGVVSASAASAWSFKSGKYNVAVGGEINMQKDEFADFDLLKDGKAPEDYTVVWASDNEDAVWVNAESGKLRADKFGKAEDGDKAVISATFTNVNTGKSATRSFTIVVGEVEVPDYKIQIDDIAVEVGAEVKFAPVVMLGEEVVKFATHKCYNGYFIGEEAISNPFLFDVAGEYTVTVAHFASKADVADLAKAIRTEEVKVTVKSAAPEFVSATQTALNAVEIVLNDAEWAAKAVADQAITVAQVVGSVEIAELVKSVEAKKDAADTVVVTLYNNIAKDATYKFTFDGYECAATVKGAGNTPAYIEVIGGKIPASDTTKSASIKIFNSAKIDITSLIDATVTYTLVDDNFDCDLQQNGAIYFFEAGKQAVVKASLDMGWDEEGNEIKDLEATGLYTSVEPETFTGIQGYAISVDGKGKGDLTYTTSTLKLSLSDEDRYLYAKYERVPFEGDKEALYISDETIEYTYYSTNESVLFVETDGELKPCKEGYASVYIKKGDAVVGSVNIKVEAARKLDTFTATIADTMLATAIADDKIEIVVNAKDQFGEAYPDVNYSIVLDSKVEGFDGADINDFFAVDDSKAFDDAGNAIKDGKITLTLNDGAKELDEGAVQVLAFTVKATDDNDTNNVKPQKRSVSVRNNEGLAVKTSSFEVSANEIDLALNKKEETDYNATIKLVNLDDKKYDLGVETNLVMGSAVTTGNDYCVVITKVGKADWKVEDFEDYFKCVNGTISITPVLAADDKLETGTYKAQLYKKQDGGKMQAIKSETIVIKDTTPTVTAKVVKTNTSDMKAALEFYINGAKVDAKYVDTVAIKDSVELDSDDKIFVKSVTLTLLTDAFNKDSNIDWEYVTDVTVGQLFIY